MKQLKKIILSLIVFISCLFYNSVSVLATETLDCSKIFGLNSKGEQVKLLQKELTTVVGCILTIDGIYGTNTRVCVREFQKINKLGQDGVVGPNTCKKLNSAYLSEIEAEKNNQSTSKQALDCSSTLALNSKGEKVKLLQKQLNEVMNCNLTADGLFGNKTKVCVTSFQKKNSLTQDGIVGPNTCKKLNNAYLNNNNNSEEEKEEEKETSTETDLICGSSNTLSTKSKGEQVKILQKKLNATMGCDLSEDGIYGSGTKTCVQNFQKKTNLSADGIVGTSTCKKINKVYENRNDSKINKQGKESILNCHNILSANSTNSSQVKILQKELNKVLNCNLTEDGSFGTKTKQCVSKFQSQNKLTADGVVGSSTCGKLNAEYLKNNTYVVSDTVSVIYKKDSTSSKEIATAIYGTIFKVYGTTTKNNSTWYKIKYNNEYAYVKGSDTKKNAIVLDISEQNLKLYKSGKLSLDSLVITGTKNEFDTPLGRHTLKVDEKINAAIELTDDLTFWETADYWIPFAEENYKINSNTVLFPIGFCNEHWRNKYEYYDKNTYKTNGTHGWVNMQKEDTKSLYESITEDIKVYVVE